MTPGEEDAVPRVVVVTGGTRGIGRAIVEAFLATGADVVFTATTQESIDDAGHALRSRGGHAVGVRCDVASESDVAELGRLVGDRYDRLDVLVNNAAVSVTAPLADLALDDWSRTLAVNLTGAFLVTRTMIPLLAPGGSIVNIGSQAGILGEAMVAAYAASKAGLLGLTRSLARELAPGIRVNAVCPAVVETEMMQTHYRNAATARGVEVDDVRREHLAPVPLRRPQPPEAVADAVIFLSGPQASEITGQSLNVDGGMVMR